MSSESSAMTNAGDVPTVLVSDTRGRQLLCFLEELIPLDGHDYVLLTPVDTPVCLFQLDDEEDPELIDTIVSMSGACGANVTVVTPTADQIKAYRQATKSVHVQFLASHPDMVPVYDQVKTKLQYMR